MSTPAISGHRTVVWLLSNSCQFLSAAGQIPFGVRSSFSFFLLFPFDRSAGCLLGWLRFSATGRNEGYLGWVCIVVIYRWEILYMLVFGDIPCGILRWGCFLSQLDL